MKNLKFAIRVYCQEPDYPAGALSINCVLSEDIPTEEALIGYAQKSVEVAIKTLLERYNEKI